jgi:hypothetical protein
VLKVENIFFGSMPTRWIVIFFITIFFGCTENIEPDKSQFGYDFYPLVKGQYRIYDVEDIRFSPLEIPDTTQYQLKEVTADSIISGAGEVTYILQRWKRYLPTDNWELDSIWTFYRNELQTVVYENNIPFIKLVFPFVEGKRWDSNGLNSRGVDEFDMLNVFQSYSGTFADYPSTVRVVQEEKLDSLISLDNRFEIYAQNIGMVEKIESRLNFCQNDDCLGQKIVEEGKILTQVLIEYGEEQGE